MSDEIEVSDDVPDLPRPKHEHHEIAILGGRGEDDLSIAGGYLTAGDLVATRFFESPDDGLAIPVLYLYRHSIELSLKWLVRISARCALRDGYEGEERLDSERIEERLRNTHNIRQLADCLERYLNLLSNFGSNNRIDPATWKTLKWLDSEDQYGEAYRYAVIGKKQPAPVRPTQENINFYEQVNALHQLAVSLQHGYATELYEYEQFQLQGF
ncbi:hypothetical protein HHL19_35695 [Streptomyces sp. R302]|uniref:hypothetical protein n=1 Tax=unclassified Streptomyces TaxID=2593676 RepID=UPI00145EFF0A|nr:MULTISPECIES: hypothetical protein [unclassified Streptomyces]NML55116.1 hypothetical protein [Streptomyces sp. R301]NML83854.1 hypothetical protein [Streptomyces sp. R302]